MGRKRFFLYVFLLGCFITMGNPLLADDGFAGEGREISLDEWIERAEKHLSKGEDEEALSCYHQVLLLDSRNLSANIFVGNYYYLQGEKERKEIEIVRSKKYKSTNEKYEAYQKALIGLWPIYVKAKKHLEVVLTQFPSSEVKKTLNHIEELHQIIQ